MTISTQTSSIFAAGNGITTVFNFPFVADLASDIVVKYTDTTGLQTVVQPGNYTININPPPVGGLWGIGGSVTYPLSGPPIPVGSILSIIRQVPYLQSISVANQGAFYPQAVEQAMDILELQIQQIANAGGPIFVNSPLCMTFRVFGAGATPNTGILGDLLLPFPVKIVNWTLQADQSGSMAIDIWQAPYADNTPPTVFNSICSGLYPTLSSQQQIQSSTLTGWTVEIPQNTAFRFNLRSISTIQNFTLSLTMIRTDLPVLDGGGSGGAGGGGGSGGTGGGSGGGSGGGPTVPTGPAGGDLTGTYPNPVIASGVIDTDELAANAVINGNLAQMPAHTYKGNNTGSTANPIDVTATQLAADISPFLTLASVPKQGILFSLSGGAYALVSSFPAGAAGPTASRTSQGVASVTLGTTALTMGWFISNAAYIAGGSNEGTTASIVGTSNLAASGTYAVNIQSNSSKTFNDAGRVLLLFY